MEMPISETGLPPVPTRSFERNTFEAKNNSFQNKSNPF